MPKGKNGSLLRRFFSIAIPTSIVAVVAGVGWIAFGEISKSEAVHADVSFSMVDHQTGRMGESLDIARTFISTEFSAEIGQIADISTLLDEWSPRYQQAQTGYRRFDAAIIAAENNADAYFAAQRALTERFHNQELRTRAQADDDAEFQQYEQWRERAGGVRVEALEIMHRLSDMDTNLQKLKLRSDFSLDVGGFSEVPSEILALEEELAQFRIASENIREIIASPFDTNS